MESLNLERVSEQIESPAYVFSGGEFRERAQTTVDILGPDIKICYSIKANPYLLAMLPDEF